MTILDPTLADLHAAAMSDPAACGALGDWYEEHSYPSAARWARHYEAPDIAMAEYRGWKFGFHSPRAAEQVGAAIYLDTEGREVAVTLVCATMEYAETCSRDDMKYVGKVTRCVKPSDGGIWGRRIDF